MTDADQYRFWHGSRATRVKMMRAGLITFGELCKWSARCQHEVPLLNGEFEFIAINTPEVAEAEGPLYLETP